MITSNPPVERRASARSPATDPRRLVARLLPVGIAVMLAIDWRLGAEAEYFDAIGVLEAWGQVIGDGAIEPGHEFIVGQDAMGDVLALAIGSVVFVLEPALALAVVVYPVCGLIHLIRGRRR